VGYGSARGDAVPHLCGGNAVLQTGFSCAQRSQLGYGKTSFRSSCVLLLVDTAADFWTPFVSADARGHLLLDGPEIHYRRRDLLGRQGLKRPIVRFGYIQKQLGTNRKSIGEACPSRRSLR
jgi:hypothetical protein